MSHTVKFKMKVVRKECPKIPMAPLDLKPKKCPKAKDRWAYMLSRNGLTQEEIAKEIGCSQASVCRAIKRVEVWRVKTLPEERLELTVLEQFHLACDRQQAHLARLQRTALADYEQSKQPVPMKKKITTTYKTGETVDKVVERVEEWTRPGSPKAALLTAAQRMGTESTLLSGGCAGGKLMADDAVDHEEVWRWDRVVKSNQEQIKQLEEEVQGLKEQLAAAKTQPAPPAEERKCELASAEKVPEMQQKITAENDATTLTIERSGEASALESPRENSAEKVNNLEGSAGGEVVPGLTLVSGPRQENAPQVSQSEPEETCGPASGRGQRPAPNSRDREAAGTACPTLEEPRKYRWDDWHRQEALDYYCQIHNLPRATLEQTTGIPDPKNCTPKEWLEKGIPTMIRIDRSAEEEARFQALLRRRDAQRERERW